MKKYVQLYNDTTGLPLTGKAIRLIRDGDGLQVDLAERGTSGVYRAASIDAGIYSVWDVTSTPVDLDQKVDVLSSLAKEPLLSTSTATKFLDATKTWRVPGISDISGLSSALSAKEPSISTAASTQAYFGNKVFRAIDKADLSWFDYEVAQKAVSKTTITSTCDFVNTSGLGTHVYGTMTVDVIEFVPSHSYGYKFTFYRNDNYASSAAATRLIQCNYPKVSSDQVWSRFIAFSRTAQVVLGIGFSISNTTPDAPIASRMVMSIGADDAVVAGYFQMSFVTSNFRNWIVGEGLGYEVSGVING